MAPRDNAVLPGRDRIPQSTETMCENVGSRGPSRDEFRNRKKYLHTDHQPGMSTTKYSTEISHT